MSLLSLLSLRSLISYPPPPADTGGERHFFAGEGVLLGVDEDDVLGGRDRPLLALRDLDACHSPVIGANRRPIAVLFSADMPNQSEERRMAALLRDLMLRSGTAAPELESRLGWESGRLSDLLAGKKGLSFETLLEILPVLDATPGDFFAQLGSLRPREGVASSEKANRVFEESRRVVKDAIARRRAWKEERTTTV